MPSRNALEILKLFKNFHLFPWSAASELFAPNLTEQEAEEAAAKLACQNLGIGTSGNPSFDKVARKRNDLEILKLFKTFTFLGRWLGCRQPPTCLRPTDPHLSSAKV